jgi:hypothetical protein
MQLMSRALSWVVSVYVGGSKDKREASSKIRGLVCTCIAENHLGDFDCWELGDFVDVFRN